MRFDQVKRLFGLFFLYFLRKVLNAGILKNPLFKIFIGIALAIMLFVVSGLMYVFFAEVGNQNQEVDLLLKVYSSTVVMWTAIIFIFLKILFSKSNNFLKMTVVFPVSMKERNLALLLFEVIMMFFFISMVSFSVVAALLLIYGFQYFSAIVSNIFYLSISLYLIMQLFYSLIGWGLERVRLSKIKTPLLFFAYTSYFLIFFRLSTDITTGILASYLNKKASPEYMVLVWDRLNSLFGFGITTAIFIAVTTLLMCKLVYIPDRTYLQQNNFNRLVRIPNCSNYLFAYFLMMVRRTENINLIVMAYLIFSYLIYMRENGYLLWPIFIFSINGIYLYIQTEEIRFLQFKIRYSAWKDYLYLLVSQLMWGGLLSLPIFLVFILKGNSILNFLYLYGMYFFSIILSTMVGILFPPKKENPFSVFLSFIIVFVSFALIGFSMFFLNLPELWNRIISVLVFVACIPISIQGLLRLKEEYRNEKSIYVF